MKKGSVIWIVACAILVVILVIAAYFIYSQKKEMEDFKTQVEIENERKELEKEYADLAFQYDQYEGGKILLNNDSLVQKLDTEKMKVQRLLEELRTVKATDAARINELKKELATLRSVMRNYIIQIDSLNSLNKKLMEENKSVTSKYQAVAQTASQLQKDKEQLSHKVTLASKLDAVGITVTPINKRGKETNKISKIEQIKVCFTIAKNVTAEVGEKYIYLRIMKPDGDILVKSRADLFHYEDKEINFSTRKLIEYDGEEMNLCLYWNVEEFLYPGDYRVDIFADNYMIGSKSFSLEK